MLPIAAESVHTPLQTVQPHPPSACSRPPASPLLDLAREGIAVLATQASPQRARQSCPRPDLHRPTNGFRASATQDNLPGFLRLGFADSLAIDDSVTKRATDAFHPTPPPVLGTCSKATLNTPTAHDGKGD